MQILNDSWPWWGTLRGNPLSVADLVARGTLAPDVAAALGWAIQHGICVFVAAGPPGAGKSTVANALLEYLPENAQVYVTSGGRDRIEIPPSDGPVYLLINELSAHMPVYLYGRAAQRAFERLGEGIRIIGTLHARSAGEALAVMCYEAELAPRDIAAPFLFTVIAAYRDGRAIIRRVSEVGFLPPGGDLVLVARTHLDQLVLEPAGIQALADWSGVGVNSLREHIADAAAQMPV